MGKRYYNVSSKSLNLEHIIAPNKLNSGNYTLLIKNTGGDLLKNIAFNVSNEINNKQESSSSQPQYSQNNIPAIEKISLSLKKVTVKKSAKKLILQVTLKQGKNLLKNKKIIFKFNGKKYSGTV